MKPLKINLCILICVLCTAYGCGSDSGSGPAASGNKQTSKTSPTGKSPQVIELLPDQKPGPAAPNIKFPSTAERQNIEVLPPTQPGGKGVTQAEIDAMRARPVQKVDPKLVEVLPPIQPGGKGITQAEIDAVRARPVQEIDPKLIEVLPPTQPGGKGITQAEIDAQRPTQQSYGPPASPPPVEAR